MFDNVKWYFRRVKGVLLSFERIYTTVQGLGFELDKIEKKLNDDSWRKLDVSLNQEIKFLKEKIDTANRMNHETWQILDLVRQSAALVLKQETRASNNPSRPRKSKAPSRRPR